MNIINVKNYTLYTC